MEINLRKNLQDTDLIELFNQGSKSAFEQFYKRHQNNVYRYIVGMLGRIEPTEELCASTWEIFLRNSGGIKLNPKAYLYAIARSQTFDYLRLNKNREKELSETIEEDRSLLEINVELNTVIKSINRLPQSQRDALLLKHFAGLSIAEIAEYQNINHESAKSRIRYALKKLRSYFNSDK